MFSGVRVSSEAARRCEPCQTSRMRAGEKWAISIVKVGNMNIARRS